jgi:hypothetical protein
MRRLLVPLVRVLLRNGVSVGDFNEHVKKIYVDVATEDFTVAGRKPSISRTAVLTGLTRKEVSRLSQLDATSLDAGTQRYNRAARVISGWVRDPDFADDSGAPATLKVDGGKASFAELVRRHGADVPARAVLDELVRVGAIDEQLDGRLRLLTHAYVPTSDEVEKLAILGSDVAELIATIDHNITQPQNPFFQRKVSYDNLPADFLCKLRVRASEQAQLLLEELDREMSLYDLDSTTADTPGGRDSDRRLCSIGIYYYETEFSTQEPPQEI